MKILFVGYHNPHFETMTECIERAIVDLGHDLCSFDYRAWKIPGRIRDRVPFLHKWDLQSMNDGLFSRARSFKPDLLLVNGAYTISAATIRKIKAALPECRTINWIADYPLKFNEYSTTGPSYDHFLTSGTDALKRYEAMGHTNGKWLPFACDPSVHHPTEVSEADKKRYGCDVCFVGGNYTERRLLLDELTDFDLGVWGIGWHKLPPDSPLRNKIRGAIVDISEWTKIFSASKICLNIIGHRCDVMDPFVPEEDFRMTNTKVFEILSCGGFQLVDAKADVLSLFKDNEHLAVYRNAQELREKIIYFLSHPEEMARIKKAGMESVRQNHTYKERINQIISRVCA